MDEKKDFLRVVRLMYNAIKIIDYTDKTTDIDKLKELKRWQDDLSNQAKNIEEALNSRIMLGQIAESDRKEMEQAIIEISTDYLKLP